MKITISRVIHFVKAADTIAVYVNEQIKATPEGPQGVEVRNKLLPMLQAADTITRMANDLQSAEVSVKG